MKYLVSALVVIFSATTVTSLFAHTNRLHKSRLEIRQEQAEKAASIKLMQDNKFEDQIKTLQALQEKLSNPVDPQTQLKRMDRYVSELQESIDIMQQMVNQYGSEADYIVATHGDNVLPLSYRFTMMRQLLQSTSVLQKFMIEHLKYQERDFPPISP